MPKPQRNQIVELDIKDLAYGGQGVGRVDGFVYFVNRALPGERITARVLRSKKNHAEAQLESVLSPSPHRIAEPPCPLFGNCGGCTWQNLSYEQQLHWKQKQVVDSIERIGGIRDFTVHPILPSPQVWNYRNKMEYSFGLDADGQTILGFHLPGRFDRILPVSACLIHPTPFDDMLRILIDHARTHILSGYDPRRHTGLLRHAVMRHSHTTGHSILALLTKTADLPEKQALADRLAREVSGFKGMLWGLNEGRADIARIDRELWRHGEPDLTETVNGLTFAISPQSFFQTNTAAAEQLYRRTVEIAGISPGDRVFDAYCGGGGIGLHCARQGARVVGVEQVREAVWDARANARRNGIDGATFIAAPMAEGLELARHAAGAPFNHVLIDPPRGGMDKRSLRGLIDLRAPVFTYVSCNPSTLARDLAIISEAGYRLEQLQPVDMFPHTFHIETIARLTLPT